MESTDFPVSFRKIPNEDDFAIKNIAYEEDVTICDGKIQDNPCSFAKKYNCITKECEYTPIFLFLMIGLPIIAFIIFAIGIVLILRKTNKY